MDRNRLLAAVPVGKANALPGLVIWRTHGEFGETSTMNWLKLLAASGDVKMEKQPYRRGVERWVFWREDENT